MAKNMSERKPLFGHSRSHSLIATNKKQSLNNQKVNINGKTVVMTAREAKKFKKAD